MNNFCFLNGKIMPLEEAKVGVSDIGLMRGYGVYDGLTAVNGKPFRFSDHWQRFTNGAHALSLNIPITEESCEKKIIELLEKCGLANTGARPPSLRSGVSGRANVRMVLTGGETLSGIEYDFENPTFFITVEKWQPLESSLYTSGAKLVTYRHKREMPEHKTTNYITAVMLQNWRKEEGAVEVLYTYDGEVLECATSNICIVKGGKLITPAENVLGGITLKTVFELAEEMGLESERRIINESELREAEEVFITSSFKDIVPIVKIDDFTVAEGVVGPVTQKLISRFAEGLNM